MANDTPTNEQIAEIVTQLEKTTTEVAQGPTANIRLHATRTRQLLGHLMLQEQAHMHLDPKFLTALSQAVQASPEMYADTNMIFLNKFTLMSEQFCDRQLVATYVPQDMTEQRDPTRVQLQLMKATVLKVKRQLGKISNPEAGNLGNLVRHFQTIGAETLSTWNQVVQRIEERVPQPQ